jgi:hypothetical protein
MPKQTEICRICKAWTGLIWLRIEKSGGLLQTE